MTKHVLLTLLCLCSFYTFVNAQPNCTPQRYVNNIFTHQVTQEPALYGSATTWLGGNQNLSFDFYEPAGDALTKRPLIIMSFGGSFLAGDKRQAELVDYCEEMARKGFCVASIDYRIGFNILSTDSAVRAVYRGLQDFRAAVRYFRANAATYNIDPNNIFGGGNSAGSINAIHSAYAQDSDRTMNSILGATFNNPDLGWIDASGNNLTTSGIPKAVVNLWGGIGDLVWIDAGDAPIISFHGLSDNVVLPGTGSPFNFPIFPPLSGSVDIHPRVISQGITPEELHTFPGGGHELWTNAGDAQFIIAESADFLHQIIRPSTVPVVTGNNAPCTNATETYCINAPNPTSDYCWTVTGGTIVADNNDCITVQWGTGTSGTITAIELNCLEAQSFPTNYNVTISAGSGVNASFTFIYTSNSVNFTNTSTGGNTYLWDFGDGNTSTAANPTHTYATNGNYTVTLTVTNASGCSDMTTTMVHQFCQSTLTVATNPTASGLYQAFIWVYSDKELAPNANVDFKGGDFILMDAGFQVNSGNVFLAETVPCQN